MAKKIYILDTSVCLTDANCIRSYGINDIVLPLKVLEEIDNNKKRQDGVGANARAIIRNLDSLREKGSLSKGVRIEKGKGLICVKMVKNDGLPEDLDLSVPDNEIISVALNQKKENPKRKIIVATRDINMRVKCDSLGLITEDFQSNQVVQDTKHIYQGFLEHLIDEPVLDLFYSGDDIYIEKEDLKLYPNQFVMLVSNQNEKKTGLALFKNYNKPLIRINGKHKKAIWGVVPKNKEQMFALELLKDKKVDIVTLVGKAGCGKTLLAIAAGLQQVVETEEYRRLVISRPIQPMGRDIGFLPGTIDEAQNLTAHELKTILTRVGENTKIVLTGDVEQIDNVYIDETSNGLTHAVEKFKNYDLSGHVTLLKGERSKVATIASKIL